ncbi:MAG: nucleotide-binding protein [Candidatus Methanofastidiosia archaeon]
MNDKIKQVAIYGKGGIGKSTISSHLAVALTRLGKNVLLVGCDPKSDSVINLLDGIIPKTILDIVSQQRCIDTSTVDDVIKKGYGGVWCCEAGGPEPGVGCAGRGIIIAIESLQDQDIFRKYNIDIVIYDVPGDVVCGGFAMPIRKGLAQEVYIVTSHEFSSLYAANNIIKGIRRFADAGGGLLSGIISNSRGIECKPHVINEFADAWGTEIVATIPWDNELSRAELYGKTLFQMNSLSPTINEFMNLGGKIISQTDPISPTPLDYKDMYVMFKKLVSGGINK